MAAGWRAPAMGSRRARPHAEEAVAVLEAGCAGGRREGGAPARECLGGGAPVRRGEAERATVLCSVLGVGMGSRRGRDARAGFTGGLGGRN